MTAGDALITSVHETVSKDGALNAILGGPKIYVHAPKDVTFPYVTLGEPQERAAASGDGTEHFFTLHAWSRQGGHREAHLIAGAILQALDDAPLSVPDRTLVNLSFNIADIRREADGRTYRAIVRFRAVTEPSR